MSFSDGKITIIRDPIHGYIHLNELEEKIVSTKIFRRLQNIKQTATAYLTYPSHHVDRFSHSLGTLEIMNKIARAALNNSDPSTLNQVLDRSKIELDLKTSNEEEIKKILIQLFKLAGLLHDIGHLPMSHIGEEALQEWEGILYSAEYSKDQDYGLKIDEEVDEPPDYKIHELATYFIIRDNEELHYIFNNNQHNYKIWLCKIFELAPSGIFKTIKKVLANDIDADRADYLIRDGKTSGINFGEYDLDRLIESMVFFINEKEEIEILPKSVSLSSAETFLLERYKIYKWLIHQQFVVLTEAIMANLIKKMIEWSFEKNHPLSSFLKLDDFHYKNYIIDSIPFDDHFIWAKLREMFTKIQEANIRNEVQEKYKPDFKKAEVSLKILLFREKYAKALFKNPFDYRNFDMLLKKRLNPNREWFEKPLLNEYATLIESKKSPIQNKDKISKAKESDNYFLIEVSKSRFKPYAYTEHQIPIKTPIQDLSFTYKDPVSKLNLIFQDEENLEPRPITKVSPLIKGLKSSWENDMQLFLFVVSYDILTKESWQKVLKEVHTMVLDHSVDNFFSAGKPLYHLVN